MRRYLVSLGAAIALAAPGSAPQAQTPVVIDTVGINAVFSAYSGNASPGCAAGVYQDGRIVFGRGYGMADLERSIPITPRTLFDLGSTSKQFTAAAIALLVLDGRLAFEDDVRKYIPEVPDYGKTITIDHLVRHTSGLRDYIGLLVMGGRRTDDASDDADALAAIARQRALNFVPGTEWSYSNSGFFLLSQVVQRVAGVTLADFARERIFDPLGMTGTEFRNDHLAILPGRALAYSPGDDGRLQHDVPNWDQLGDGAVWSSIEELVAWDRNFLTPRIGGTALGEALAAPGRLDDGSTHGYGRGVFLDQYRGHDRIHHGGAWGGFRAMLMRFPSARTSVAVLCNVGTANTQRLAEGVADVVLADRFSAPAAPPPAAREPAAGTGRPVSAARYAGLYYDEPGQAIVRIEAAGDSLIARVFGARVPLVAVGEDRFDALGLPASLRFGGGAGGAAQTVELLMRGRSEGNFSRVRQASPTRSDLAAYVGRYYSPELDATYRIELSADTLRVVFRTLGRRPLRPAMPDAFEGQGLIRFARGARGRVTGFEMSINRVKGLRFERRD